MDSVINTNTKRHNMTSILAKLWATLYAKAAYIIGMSWAVSFLMPIQNFILLTAFLTVADAISGMLAAKKRGEAITSRGFYRTIEKFVIYFLAILSAAGLHATFIAPNVSGIMPNVPIVEVVAASICFTEFLSFKENVFSLTGVDILGGFKKIFNQFSDLLPTKNGSEKG